MILKDKVAVLSGVGDGVGVSAAHIFAREGAAVVLLARTAARLDRLVGEIEAKGGRALAVPADVASDEDCRRVAAVTAERFGGADILVNIAFASGQPGLLMDSKLDDTWSAPFDICVKGSLRLTQALLAQLEARQGNVVMINTTSARTYHPRASVYGVAKGGLQTATRILAEELGPRGIRVNTVAPGYIDGPPLAGAFVKWAETAGVSVAEIRKRTADSLPLRYIPTSEDVAEAILFMASPRARGITGATLDVNGGEYIPQ